MNFDFYIFGNLKKDILNIQKIIRKTSYKKILAIFKTINL